MPALKRQLFSAMGLLFASTLAHGQNLLDVYSQALDADPQLRAAQAGHTAALEAKPQSRAGLLPQVNLSADTTYIDYDVKSPASSSGDYNTNGYTLSLAQPLYHQDTLVQLKQADARIKQADAELEAERQNLIVRVTEAYLNVLAAIDNLEFVKAEKRALEQQLHQTRQRFEVGLSAITDVHEAQAGYDAAVAAEIVAQNKLDTQRESLREITNQDPNTLAVLKEEFPLAVPEPADIDAWVERALGQNLQLQALESATESARQEIARRKAGHYPTLDLVASHNYSDNASDSDIERNDNVIGLQLSVPIYSGGLTSSQTREAVAQHTQALENLEQQRRAVIRQTREAYMNVVAGISNVQARKQALASAITALDATQTGFEVGTRTAVDVLNAQRNRYLAVANYASARYNYLIASLRLKQASGTLNEADLRTLNNLLQ